MSAHGDSPDLHTVTLTDDGIVFACSGDETAECHLYPGDCEGWDDGHPHPYVPHAKCWMQDWFDNDCVSPNFECIAEVNYEVGMAGPITCDFELDYIDWRFTALREGGVR